jgi:hypothetical protein
MQSQLSLVFVQVHQATLNPLFLRINDSVWGFFLKFAWLNLQVRSIPCTPTILGLRYTAPIISFNDALLSLNVKPIDNISWIS